jgi:Nif-specific regulatory protein
MVRGNVITEQDIPCQRDQCLSSTLWKYQASRISIPVVAERTENAATASEALESPSDLAIEGATPRERLVQAMERCGWVQAKAARLLNLTPRQLGYALKKYKIEVKRL